MMEMSKDELELNAVGGEIKEQETFSNYFYLAYKPYDFSITWDWQHSIFARVGFMHDDVYHPFINHIKTSARKHQMRILHLSTEMIQDQYVDKDIINLYDYELLSTEEGATELEETRMKWVQLYLKLLCYVNGKERANFIPQMKYYRTEEGPLAGYLRAIDEMPETNEKTVLVKHLEKLQIVKWGIKYNDDKGITDFLYHVNGSTFKEQLESFFLGAWAITNIHYARDFNDEHMDSLLTMIQFSKNFINPSIDQTGRDIIEEVIQLLANLTMISTDEILIKQKHALFIQSPQLFPNHYPQVSHMFYGMDQSADFNLHSIIPDLKPLMPNEAIYRSKVIQNEEFVRKVFLAIAT
ncbi:hypothetical protein [Lysinibacillus fusiformis]|uniref:hypothetical protein n=1 Tax=Lysinibacillus fusiformis TaxID=28031 RepID=UPI0023A97E24|nr:hypothetical protein [Lysinibacillus fusiformis]